MKHLFVPYPLAKRAEKNNFDEPCLTVYEGGYFVESIHYHDCYRNSELKEIFIDKISAPTYQQLIDWFREKHGIALYSHPVRRYDTWKWYVERENFLSHFTRTEYYEALTAALTEAFKVIKSQLPPVDEAIDGSRH